MAKTILLFTDGTWNGNGNAESAGGPPTNVLKLFLALDGDAPPPAMAAEMERTTFSGDGSVSQVAKYLHGVGDSTNPLVRFAEGTTGAGIVSSLVRGYTFISRHYAPGDHICLIGFSHGAYIARAVADFIVHQGLLDWSGMGFQEGGDPRAYHAGVDAWMTYRLSRASQIPAHLGALAHEVIDFFGGHSTNPRYVENIPVHAVGAFDTIGALGIPVYVDSLNSRLDVFRLADAALSPQVLNGFHAVAADEQRVDFTPSLWEPRIGIEQALFPGAHSDVGGGYPAGETGLSDWALLWMASRLKRLGVVFGPRIGAAPNVRGLAHQPWLGTKYAIAPREFPPGLDLSRSSIDRVEGGLVPAQRHAAPAVRLPYRPSHLVPAYYTDEYQPAVGVRVSGL